MGLAVINLYEQELLALSTPSPADECHLKEYIVADKLF